MTSSTPAKPKQSKATGILVRTSKRGVKSYRAEVWDNAAGRTITKTFPTQAAAKSWRSAMQTKVRAGEAGAVDAVLLCDAAAAWMDKAASGVITTKSGTAYKPSTIRGYRMSLDQYVKPSLGARKLTDLRVDIVQSFADDLAARGLSRSSIRSHLIPLRLILSDARRRRLLYIDPLSDVQFAGVPEKPRDRVATPDEAVRLLAAVPERDRAIWASAFYAGLRCGELMALDWSCVDLLARRITVARSYDPKERAYVAVKSNAGRRTVPFSAVLLPYLAALNRTEGLVFGEDGITPFGYTGVRKRARRAWSPSIYAWLDDFHPGVRLSHQQLAWIKAQEENNASAWRNPDAQVVDLYREFREHRQNPVTLHECRHTCASMMLEAGIEMTKVSKRMGHSSIAITVDRYGHLIPGSEDADMARFEAYLSGA